jgi:hypothetical protein
MGATYSTDGVPTYTEDILVQLYKSPREQQLRVISCLSPVQTIRSYKFRCEDFLKARFLWCSVVRTPRYKDKCEVTTNTNSQVLP